MLGPDDKTPTVAPRIDSRARRAGDRLPTEEPRDTLVMSADEIDEAIRERRRMLKAGKAGPTRLGLVARIKAAWGRTSNDYRAGLAHGCVLLAAWVALVIVTALGIKHGWGWPWR